MTNAHAQPARIAAVNSDRILRESVPAISAQKKLEREFSQRDHALQHIAKQLAALSEKLAQPEEALAPAERKRIQAERTQLDADFQRKEHELRNNLNQRRNEELAAVLERANQVIRRIAQAEHYDLIVQEAVYVNPRIDITDQVLKALAAPNAGN